MSDTSTLQPNIKQNLSSTMVWESKSSRRDISRPHLLLPEVGNRIASIGTFESAQIQNFEPNEKLRALTVPVDANPKQIASFKALESWMGQVTEVDQNGALFSAMVVSDLNPEIREIAEFTFDEISEDDQSRIRPGAIFYWSVGYQINEFGGRMTASILRFKRLRHWTRKELELAKERSSEYADWFVGG